MSDKFKEQTFKCPNCGMNVICARFLIKSDKDIVGMCGLINNSGIRHIRNDEKTLYASIPQDKRQAFLDNFRNGNNVGKSYELAGLTQEEGFAVLNLNIEKISILRDEAK